MNNPFLSMFEGSTALLAPGSEARVQSSLAALAAHEHAADFAALSMRAGGEDFWSEDAWWARFRPYIVRDRVLYIPVQGVLLNKFPYQYGAFATGYEYIYQAFLRGMDDPAVDGIVFSIDSPGGMVAGCFDVVDRIYARRGEKPIRAFADEHAYSAAYAIASVADKINVSRTGGVGSIGVVTSHVDISKAMDEIGIKVTFIYAGKHKVDGNPYEALPDDVRERIQARIDATYDEFVALVARNRNMDEAAVRATEALTYGADEAVSVGLADTIGPADDAASAFALELSNQDVTGDEAMSKQDTPAVVDQAAVEAARTEGVLEGRAEGAKAERERIAAILGCDEAKGREALAHHIAMSTDMSAEQAKGILAASPLAVAPKEPADAPAKATKTPFEVAMEKGNPELGAGDDVATAAVDPVKVILADYRAAGGTVQGA